MNFQRFLTTFWKFSNNCLKGSQMFPNILWKFSMISEYCPRLSRKINVFWSYASKFKYSLRDKHDISEVIDIFTNKDMENM